MKFNFQTLNITRRREISKKPKEIERKKEKILNSFRNIFC